jgi:hypothetical protein
MKKNNFIIGCLLLVTAIFPRLSLACGKNCVEIELFGVDLRIETPSQAPREEAATWLKQMSTSFSRALDPDCLWRDYHKACSPLNAQELLLLKDAETKAASYFNETGKVFDIKTEKRKRDFAGLSQGWVLDLLKSKLPDNFLADFSGDIYFTGGFTPVKQLTIGDPLSPSLTYAEVLMPEGGWMIASTGKNHGGQIREKKNPDLAYVVLFARKDFSGSRLDAWATSLVAGGSETLSKILTLKDFKDQWGALVFKQDGSVETYGNVKLTKTSQGRQVTFSTKNFDK